MCSYLLEIRAHRPNALFEDWLQSWLTDAERKNSKAQYKLREALESLRKYPLPLDSGRDCSILKGFGTKLCNLIDEEMRQLKSRSGIGEINFHQSFVEDVQQVVKKVEKRKPVEKPPKVTKKQQKAIAEEEERQRQVIMPGGNFRIILLVDTQETSGKNKRALDQTRGYLESLDVQYEVRRLTVGDFLWIARDGEGNELVLPYIIERKRMDDLSSSIKDGRFHEQKHRLKQCGIQNVLYLIEDYGDNEQLGLPLDNLLQAMVNTQIHSGFSVVQTENHWRSMVYLQGMTQTLIRLYAGKLLVGTAKEDLKECHPQDAVIGLLKFKALYEDSARNSQLTIREVFMQQLLQLHSLSLEKVMALVEVYQTPRLLLDALNGCADEKQAIAMLAGIRSGDLQRPMGEKLARIIYDFYMTEF